MCEVAHVKDNLRKMLYEYFQSPSTAKMELGKVKDLLNFYLTIPSGGDTVVCDGIGTNSNVPYYIIVNEADNITTAIPYCEDGTEFGKCSANNPKYCSNGRLIDKCSVCGCSSGKVCQNNMCVTAISNVTFDLALRIADCATIGTDCEQGNLYEGIEIFGCALEGATVKLEALNHWNSYSAQ